MMKVVIVKTYTDKSVNGDGQHDCAGTWALAPNSKNEETQVAKAEGVKYLVHYANGEFKTVYRVAGFHTERRDLAERIMGEEPNCSISVGVRFHLRLAGESTKDTISRLVDGAVDVKNVRACRVLEL